MAVNEMAKALIPPDDNTVGKRIKQWRWVIAVAVAFLLVNGAAGRGWLVGFGAYASSSDVQIILELQFAEELRALQKQMCDLPLGKRATLERVIEEYQRRYQEVTGRRYPLVAC
jgi:hypothetical protein